MKIETKFNLGQKVYHVGYKCLEKWIDCAFCGATGMVVGANQEKCSCPKCGGRKGRSIREKQAWSIDAILTLGEVRAHYRSKQGGIPGKEIFSNMGPQAELYEEKYMAVETGIGSGSVYKGTDLFAAKEEAQTECDRRNKEDSK